MDKINIVSTASTGVVSASPNRLAVATAAMQGILSNPLRGTPNADVTPEQYAGMVAEVSFEFADALIAKAAR